MTRQPDRSLGAPDHPLGERFLYEGAGKNGSSIFVSKAYGLHTSRAVKAEEVEALWAEIAAAYDAYDNPRPDAGPKFFEEG